MHASSPRSFPACSGGRAIRHRALLPLAILLLGLALCAVPQSLLAAQTPPPLPAPTELVPSTLPIPPEPVEPQVYPFSPGEPLWTRLEPGLGLGRFLAGPSSSGRPLEIVILRIDPRFFTFTLHTGSDPAVPLLPTGASARPLKDWAEAYGLAAAINAGMYLPDGLTNTGYLRVGTHLNNHRLVGRFGAFFLTGRAEGESDLPEAVLVDRTASSWETLLPRYGMVVQNYRLISSARKNLWQPGGPEHSIAAVGTDGSGCILFIHCREPLTGLNLGNLLLALPIDIRTVMYVEGGSQAGLLLNSPTLSHTWMGRHPADFWTDGNMEAPLPNIIGARRKAPLP